MEILTEALHGNTSITSLNLEQNNFRKGGMRKLAEVLQVNSSIASLRLQSNQIYDEGLKSLAGVLFSNSTLTYLSLGSYPWGYSDGTKAFFEALATNTSLTNLHFHFGDEKLKKDNKHLLSRNYSLIKCSLDVPKVLERNRQLMERKKLTGEYGCDQLADGELVRLGLDNEFALHPLPSHTRMGGESSSATL